MDFIVARDNVVFLGPPGTGKTHLAIGISVRACQAGYRVAFGPAAERVDRLATAHAGGTLHDELRRLGRYPLLHGRDLTYRRQDDWSVFELELPTASTPEAERTPLLPAQLISR